MKQISKFLSTKTSLDLLEHLYKNVAIDVLNLSVSILLKKCSLLYLVRSADDTVTGQILFLYVIRKDNKIVERRVGMSIEV